MDGKGKKVLIGSLVVLMGVMLIISLSFYINKAGGSRYWINHDFYGTYKDTGFSIMSFSSNLPFVERDASYVPIILGVFAYIQLFLGIATIIFGIMYIINDNYIWKKIIQNFMIIAVSFSAWYLVEGMLYTKIMETINGANVKTLTWLAFLFCALIFIAYILCEKLIKTSDEIIAGKNGEKRNLSVKNIKNSIELIKQYKELLDSGIITEEEFNEKKKSLL